MRRQLLSIGLVLSGALLMMAGISVGTEPDIVAAGPNLQPSPRPPVFSTIVPVDKSGPPAPTAAPEYRGRITGTVIDLSTGSPAPGKQVQVGEMTVSSDSNGNYDRNGLAPGSYPVQLMLGAEEGVADQGLETIELAANALVIKHLFFHSASIETPIPLATEAIGRSLPPETPDPSAELVPSRLPITANDTSDRPLGWWLVVGAALVGMGLLLQFQQRLGSRLAPARWSSVTTPRTPQKMDERSLLESLLMAPRTPQKTNERSLLESLLDEEL
ncbi:MAG: carboxypeptidase-like regulatory domain-containing protein [Chloroflexales bacterium]|nr:carboxypeptidase-like regulatory domain-containing protein [Chloroflexales bacterium]